jgi:phosphatidate cytidylyltransferase
VEGAVGGLIGNVLFGMLFLWVATRFYGGTTDGYSGYAMMAVMGLFCGVVSQIGDLSFSLIKREFGVKDYGKLFLAHGGVLDRFDSVLFVAPVVELILKWM